MGIKISEETWERHGVDFSKLTTAEEIEKLEKLVAELVFHDMTDVAHNTLYMIKKEGGNINAILGDKELKDRYLVAVNDIKLITLDTLDDPEFLEFIEKYFVKYLRHPRINIFDKVRAKLLTIPIYFRDDLKVKIIEYLKKNKETIGDHKIKVRSQEEEKPAYVGNWLVNYDNILGVGVHDKLERVKYLTQNKNTQKLSQKDKTTLHDLLLFYDLMRLSSWEVGALDNYSLETLKPGIYYPTTETGRGVEPIPASSSRPEPEKSETENINKNQKADDIVAPPPKFQPKPQPQPQPQPQPATTSPQKIELSLSSIPSVAKLSTQHLRDISSDPHQAADSIKREVFKLIGASPMDKGQAKMSWQQSPLYKLYIAMGEESMKTKKPIKDIAAGRQQNSQPYLTEAEFKAVVEISRIF